MAPKKRAIAETLDLLLRSMRLAAVSELRMYKHLRDVGKRWIELKELLGEAKINIKQFAKQKLPRGCSYSWMERHAALYRRWDEFLEAKKLADGLQYRDESRPSLALAFDVIDWKKRFDTRSRSRFQDHVLIPERYGSQFRGKGGATNTSSAEGVPQAANSIFASAPIAVTPTTTILHGDAARMMREHIANRSVDLALADPPYFLRTPEDYTVIDYYLHLNEMKPRMREDWDRFPSIQAYEEFCSEWIDEAMRCLHHEGSLFICGMWQNAGIINRLLQIKGIPIIGEIAWVKRNGRPNISTRQLQMSHETVLWAVKDAKQYRFNYRSCKVRDYVGDYFSEPGKQMRDVWDIPCAAGHVGNGHPTPKPAALFERVLDVAGKPGGRLLDLFSGGGTGAIAALRWGMSSVSIEREHRYIALIRRNVATELAAMNLRDAAD